MELKLYEIAADLRAALDQIAVDPETGEILDDCEELDAIGEAFNAKCAGIGAYILELKATAEAVKAEKERLAKRERSITKRVDFFKSYIARHMSDCGIKKVNSDVCSISLGKPAARVIVTDASLIDPAFLIQKAPDINKRELLKALKDGEKVAGAELGYGEPSIRIS
jgi:hypothetical protein